MQQKHIGMKRETHWHEIYISWAWKFKSIGMNFLHETFAENDLYKKSKMVHDTYFELKPLNFISVNIFFVFNGKSPFMIHE